MWMGPTHRRMSAGSHRKTEAPQESCFHRRVTGLYGEHFLGSRNPRRARALGVSGNHVQGLGCTSPHGSSLISLSVSASLGLED